MSYNIITTSASNNYKDSGDTNFDGTLWITYIHDVQSCISFIKGILLYLFRLVVSVYCRVCLIFILYHQKIVGLWKFILKIVVPHSWPVFIYYIICSFSEINIVFITLALNPVWALDSIKREQECYRDYVSRYN